MGRPRDSGGCGNWAAQAQFENLIGESRSAMLADPARALGFAQQANTAATRITDEHERQLAQSQAHWLEAEALNRTGKADQAGSVAADALRLVEQIDAGSKLNGDLLATIGHIARAKGDVVAALGHYQRAFGIFEVKGERRSQAKVLQYIGTLYFEAGDYERMLKYYADSAELFDDPAIRVAARNNQGDALIELKRYDEAFVQYRQALDIARSMDSDDLVTSVITNMAYAQLSAGNVAAAQKLVSQGLASKGAQDLELAAFLKGVQAQIDWTRHNVAAARANLDVLFKGLDLAATNHDYVDFHDLAAKVYAAAGDFGQAFAHAQAYQRLDNERRAVMASTNSALMAAQFDYASQELKLTRIRAKKLETDVALEKSRERFNQLTFLWADRAAGDCRAGGQRVDQSPADDPPQPQRGEPRQPQLAGYQRRAGTRTGREDAVPRHHQPRNPHAAQWHSGHDPSAAERQQPDRPGARARHDRA